MTDPAADLEMLRAGLVAAFETADVAVKAQIAGQLRAVIKDLAALGGVAEESRADEIAARRSARSSGPTDSASSSRRGQPRRSGGRNRAG